MYRRARGLDSRASREVATVPTPTLRSPNRRAPEGITVSRTRTPTPAPPRRLVTIADAAEYLDCTPKTIRRRISDGTITGFRFGPRLIRVDLTELDAMIRVVPTAGTSL